MSPVFADHTKRWLVIGAVLAIIVNVAALGWFLLRTPSWTPLQPYATQTVNLPLTGVQTERGPSSPEGQYPTLTIKNGIWPDLPVTGEKCANETATITGTIGWRSVQPPGSTFEVASGLPITRIEGCTKFKFANPVPPDVKNRVTDLSNKGVPVSLWVVAGTETPVREGGTGTSSAWTTQTFAIRVEP